MIDYNIVIPARYYSNRLPGKPLIDILGKTMIERVWLNANMSLAQEIVIATDDERIADKANDFGANVCLTSDKHESGTDRITEVIERLEWPNDKIVLNLQGDEPLLPATLMNECAALLADKNIDIGTLASPFLSKEDWLSPNMVKVVTDCDGCAIFFSRSPIPHSTNFEINLMNRNVVHHHHGIYAYSCKSLRKLQGFAAPQIQANENLEQLKALFHGMRIKVGIASIPPGMSIDVAEDIELVIRALS